MMSRSSARSSRAASRTLTHAEPASCGGTQNFSGSAAISSSRSCRGHRTAMEKAYARHDAIVRQAITDQGGVVYKVIGDAVQAAFPTASAALAAAVDAQLGLELAD